MESGDIKDSQIDYEKALAHGSHQYVKDARYNVGDGWCTVQGPKPGRFDPKLYLEVDLKSDHLVTSILLQGKKDSLYHSYGEKLQIQWKKSGDTDFGYFKGPNGRVISFYLYTLCLLGTVSNFKHSWANNVI